MRMMLQFVVVMACLQPAAGMAQGRPDASRERGYRMQVIQNDEREHLRRQSAKCMNAYPESHQDYLQCIQNGREAAQADAPKRRYFMPMPAAYRE
jgi:hypothetical protein